MKTERPPDTIEVIELIDDESTAFGGRPGAGTALDTGGRRWIGPAAAMALVGLFAYGVATSTSKTATRAPKQAAATTTSLATSATLPRSAADDSSQPVSAYYAPDPPPQFRLQDASVQRPDHAPFEGYGYELWATQGSTATSGSWFSVATYAAASSLIAPDAYRVQAGRLSVAISHTAGGPSVTHFTEDGRIGVTITSFGWSDHDLVRLATSIQADEHSIGFSDAWFDSNHVMLSAVQPELAVQSIPAEQISYVASDDPANTVVVTVARRLQPNEGGATFDRQTALRFLLDRNTPFDVDGHAGVAGMIIGQSDRALASWIAGDEIITISAPMPVSQLISIAQSVHQITTAQWTDMELQADRNRVSSSRSEQSPRRLISPSPDHESDNPWNVFVSTGTVDGRRQISWSWADGGLTTTPTGTPQIHTVVDGDQTYVLGDLPRTITPSCALQIIGAGFSIAVPFVDVDPGADRTFAAFAFGEPGQYTIRIVGSDGEVKAIWPD